MSSIIEDPDKPLTIPGKETKKFFGSPPKTVFNSTKSPNRKNSSNFSKQRPQNLKTSFEDDDEKPTTKQQKQKKPTTNHLDRKRPSPITTPPEGSNNFDDDDYIDMKQEGSYPYTAKPKRNFVLTDIPQNQRTPVLSAYKPVDWNNMVFTNGTGQDTELAENKEEAINQEIQEGENKRKRKRRHHRKGDNQKQDNAKQDNSPEARRKRNVDSISSLFSSVLGKDVEVNSEKLSQARHDFLAHADELERVQGHHYVYMNQQNLKQAGMNYLPNSFQNELQEYAANIVHKHRFVVNDQGSEYRFRIAITGPQKSGRSTLAGVIASRFLQEIAANDQWKQTLFVPFDFKALYTYFLIPDALLKNVAEITFNSLALCYPAITPIKDSLIHSFVDITQGRTKLHSSVFKNKTLASDLQTALDLLYETWNDKSSIQPFYLNVLLLPLTLSRCFNIPKLAIVIDNYDLCNINLSGIDRFSESDSAMLSELVSLLLDNASFILVGTQTEALFNIMTPLRMDSVDLTQSVTLVSSLDIIKETQYKDKVITVTTDTTKIQVTEELFGGCTPFVAKWVMINTEFDDLESSIIRSVNEEEEVDEYDDPDEIKAEICQLFQEVFPVVLEDWGTKVVDISRKN